MRKFFLILLIFVSLACKAQIKMGASVETGLMNRGVTLVNDGSYISNSNKGILYGEISFVINYKIFFFRQTSFTTFSYDEFFNFRPHDIQWNSDAFVRYRGIEAGYNHMCLHPVVSRIAPGDSQMYRGSYDKFYVKVIFGNFYKK